MCIFLCILQNVNISKHAYCRYAFVLRTTYCYGNVIITRLLSCNYLSFAVIRKINNVLLKLIVFDFHNKMKDVGVHDATKKL